MELKNRVKLSSRISNPDEFNYNLNLLRSDINSLLAQGSLLESAIGKHVAIYNEDYIEQLNYKARLLKGQVLAMKALTENNQFSHVLKFDFDSQADAAQYSTSLYGDPRSVNTFTRESMLKVNNISGTLGLPVTGETIVALKNVTFSHPANDADYSNSKSGVYDYYILQHDADPLSVEMTLSFSQTDINYLQLELQGEFPMDITKVEYYNNGWQTLEGLAFSGVFGKLEIPFMGTTITASQLRITFKISQCRVTNRITEDKTDETLIKYLVENRTEYLSMEVLSSQTTTAYANYIYHIGVKNIRPLMRAQSGGGMFVSVPAKSIEPAHYHLKADLNKDNLSIEYFLAFGEYDKDGNLIPGSSQIVPILPENETVSGEKLLFNGDEAVLMFYPHTDLVVKCDGVALTEEDFELTGRTVNILNHSGNYTADYTPLHQTKDYLVSATDPLSQINFSATLEAGQGLPVNLTITTVDDTTTVEETEEGSPYLKFILADELLIDESLNITRYLDASLQTPDNLAPIIATSGEAQNVFISGRRLYVPFDTELYPRLFNSVYSVSGTLKHNSVQGGHKYYYAKDNSLVINWDGFSEENYGYTLARLIIVARQTDSSESASAPNLQIRDVLLFSNTFNDFLITPTTDIKYEAKYTIQD